MDRRDFLKTVAITGAALTIQRSEAMEVLTQTINKANGSNPDLVAVMGGEPEEMFRRAISELGGMKQFVKPGQKVVVKPNIGWDKAWFLSITDWAAVTGVFPIRFTRPFPINKVICGFVPILKDWRK